MLALGNKPSRRIFRGHGLSVDEVRRWTVADGSLSVAADGTRTGSEVELCAVVDWTRAGTDRVYGHCVDATRTRPSHRVATAWKLHRHPRTFARQLPGRFLAVAPTVARTFTSVARDVSRQLLRQCSAVARTIHRTLRGCCAGYHAGCCADIARLPALHSCKGMVSNQNTGFPIPESRENSRSTERHKIQH